MIFFFFMLLCERKTQKEKYSSIHFQAPNLEHRQPKACFPMKPLLILCNKHIESNILLWRVHGKPEKREKQNFRKKYGMFYKQQEETRKTLNDVTDKLSNQKKNFHLRL